MVELSEAWKAGVEWQQSNTDQQKKASDECPYSVDSIEYHQFIAGAATVTNPSDTTTTPTN